MNRKGFTIIELLIVLAILAVFASVLYPVLTKDAHGMELNTPMLATDEMVATVISTLHRDKDTTVTVLVYAKEWFPNKVDDYMNEGRKVLRKLHDGGITINRTTIQMANASGYEFAGMTPPAMDGTYLYLD